MDPYDEKDPVLQHSFKELVQLTPGEYRRLKSDQAAHHRREQAAKRHAKRQAMNAKIEQRNAKFKQQDAKRQARNIGYDQPPDNPNEVTPEQYEEIRKVMKRNRFEMMQAQANNLFARMDREARERAATKEKQ